MLIYFQGLEEVEKLRQLGLWQKHFYKGSDGGHNGLKNIQLLLNSTEYPRYRFGISDAFKKGQQVDYVLGEWSEEEKEKLKERLEISSEIIKSFALAGLNNTMNTYNGK